MICKSDWNKIGEKILNVSNVKLKYGFLRSYLFKNEPLISCPFLSSKLDSPVIKTLERHSLNVKKVSLLKKSIP